MKDHCCIKCREEYDKAHPQQWPQHSMIVCKACGNKRCPKATDHRNKCTGSNEPGQPGSVY